MNKWYRYLEIMNFGGGDKRTSTMSSLYEKPDEELDHIISDYKIILKLNEKQYNEINKLLEYKGEYSYSELIAKVSVLTEKIDKSIEYIKKTNKIHNEQYGYNSLLCDELLEILGDKENE